MPEFITVTNGRQLRSLSADQLARAHAAGYHKPSELGRTIVGDGERLYEVPRQYLDRCAEDGLTDQLAGGESLNVAALQTAACNVPPALPLAIDTLASLQEPESETHRQLQDAVEQSEGWRRTMAALKLWLLERRGEWWSQLRGSGVSVAIHVALLLILASVVLHEKTPDTLVLEGVLGTTDVIEESMIAPEPIQVTEPVEQTSSEPPPDAEPVAMEMVPAEQPNFLASISGDAIKPPGQPSPLDGTGKKESNKPASFFGSKSAAVDYAFVIDNSNSMTQGRFETALYELMLSISNLTPKQRFFVVFYSDTAYPMFHPQPEVELVPATPRNKRRLFQWLQTVQLCLRTDGKEAIGMAIDLEPDVIYVLGDGAFTDKASQYFTKNRQAGLRLHTLGMEVKPRDAAPFQQLAKSNGGTYHDVGVHAAGLELARKFPRVKNTVKGPVWGVKLKPPPKF